MKHEQSRFGDTIALGDFFADVKLILQSKPNHKKKHHGKSPPKSSRKLLAVPEGKYDEDHDESVEVVHSKESDNNIEEGEYERSGSSGTRSSESLEDEDQEHNASDSYLSNDVNENSFDDSQGLGADSDSDEESGLLRHFEGLSVEERKITRALEKSLGLAADDPDIAEAARRLLDSKILSEDFFQGEMSDDDDEDYKLYGSDTKSQDEGDDDDESLTDHGEEDAEISDSSIGVILPLDTDITQEEEEYTQTVEEIPKSAEKLIEGDVEKQTVTPLPAPRTTEDTPDERVKSPKEADSAVATSKTTVLASSNGGESEPTDGATVDEDLPTQGRQSRCESDGSFWSFDNNATTPVRETGEPMPLPPSNESTPLISRQEKSASAGPSTPLNPSIFTTVAALAEESDQEDDRRKSFN